MSRRLRAIALTMCCALTLAAAPTHAQFPDLIDLSSQFLPGVELDIPPAKSQVSAYELSLNVPLVLAERSTFLIPGASYHADAVSYSQAPPQLDQIRLLQSIDASALLVQLLPNNWSLSVRVSAGLAGDFAEIDRRLLRLNALVMASHAFSDRFVLGGGALTNYAFGGLLPLPAIYVEYLPMPELRLETFVPAFANVRYTIAKRVELGLRAEVQGNAYGIRSEQVADDWPCVALTRDDPTLPGRQDIAEPARCVDHVAYSVVSAGFHIGVRLFATLWLTSFAGHTLYRRLEPMTATDEPIGSEFQTLPNTFTVRVNLTWRVPRE